MTTVAFFVRPLGEGTGRLTRPTLPHDDGFGAGTIGAEHEMPRGRPPGLFHDGRGAGIAEERVGRTVAGIREPAERISGAKEHPCRTPVRAEQGGLVQAIDPARTA